MGNMVLSNVSNWNKIDQAVWVSRADAERTFRCVAQVLVQKYCKFCEQVD